MIAGAGHRRAAEAIADAARRRWPEAQVVCEDCLALTPAWWRSGYPAFYEWMVRHAPGLWASGYWLLDQVWAAPVWRPIRRAWNRLIGSRFLRALRANPPDVVIATHFFPAELLASERRAGRLSSRLIVVVTDWFPHHLWLAPGADLVVAGSEVTADWCRRRGVPADRIAVLGIPVAEAFGRLGDREALRRELGLDPARRTVLVASGGMGVGPLEQIVRSLCEPGAAWGGRLQLLVVCGHNERLRQHLQAVALSVAVPMQVFGFVDTMPQLMQASDLMVSKAGGLAVAEASTVGLPLVLCGVIPGQEQFNAEVVVREGAAVLTTRAEDAVAQVVALLNHPARLELMRTCARRLGRPQAAQDIVERLFEETQRSDVRCQKSDV